MFAMEEDMCHERRIYAVRGYTCNRGCKPWKAFWCCEKRLIVLRGKYVSRGRCYIPLEASMCHGRWFGCSEKRIYAMKGDLFRGKLKFLATNKACMEHWADRTAKHAGCLGTRKFLLLRRIWGSTEYISQYGHWDVLFPILMLTRLSGRFRI